MPNNARMLIRDAFRFGRVQYAPGATLGPRDTIGYEFVRILKGRVRWTCDGTAHDIGPGAFILSHPGHVEHYRWDPDGITQHDYIHFYLNEPPPQFPKPETWPVVQTIEPHDILHPLFQHIVDLKHSGHPMMMPMIKQTVQQMLFAWAHQLHRFDDPGFQDFSLPVQRVMDLVFRRWQDQQFRPPTLDTMVDQARVSRSTFIRSFQAECGSSPARFFEDQRLHLARFHLLSSDRTIEQIAHHLQYPNPFQFSRNFKQHFGQSPRHHRQAGPTTPTRHPITSSRRSSTS